MLTDLTVFKYFSSLLKNAIISIIFLALLLNLKGQNGITAHPSWYVKPVFGPGFIMAHRISIGHLIKGYPANYEFNIVKPTAGNKLWHLENNRPDIGLTLQCMDFRNPEELGYAITAAPFIEIPFNKTEKVSRLIMRLSWGATYITKPFDIATNHKNVAIGSHVNAFVQFRWFWHLQLNKQLRFEPGITFTHASNGKAKNPNLGLNVLGLSAGLNYNIKPRDLSPVKVDSSARVKSRNELLFYSAIGFNQRSVNTAGLKCYVVSASFQHNIRNTHKFNAGFDVYHDDIYQIDYFNVKQSNAQGLDRIRISARAGYSYNVGRLSFPIEIGYYVFQKVNPDAVIVSRLGVRYYSKSGLVAHFGLRTHYAVAYDFEYGLGYRLFLR